MLADMEARLNVIEADQAKVRATHAEVRATHAEVRATHAEVRATHAEVRATHAEVRADQVTQAEQIALVQKQSEEDLIFMRDLNAQMEACLAIKV
jgi:hypothetical protein